MQSQLLSRNVTSKTQVRSSSGSGKLTHSCAPGGGVTGGAAGAGDVMFDFALPMVCAQLVPELTGGQQATPELIHDHPLVGCVVPVAGEADAEKEQGCVEDPT